MDIERRTFPRLSTALLGYRHPTLGSDGGELVRTIDVGLNGLSLESLSPREAGELVTVTISMQNEVVDIDGKVVRCTALSAERWEIGIALVKPTRRYWQLLALTFADALDVPS